MNKKLKRISQVGIIVKEREKAMEQYGKFFGIEKWDVMNAEELPVPMEVDGKEGKLPLHLAIATMDNGFEIEIIQPIGECAYMTWLKEHGPGVHHFAVVLPDKNARFKELHDAMIADGGKVWTHAKMLGLPEGEGMNFTYMDMRDSMGAIIEMYDEPRE